MNSSHGTGCLNIRALTKIYRNGVKANDNVHLTIQPGEVFGLIGPNGAGKTTLVKQIIGLAQPTSGSIHLGDVDFVSQSHRARSLCSYLPQGTLPIDTMTMRAAVEIVGRIRGGRKKDVREQVNQLIERLEIGEWRNEMGMKVSGGINRLYGFAMAAIMPGRIIILDEPTNDVDPLRRRLMWDEIRRLADDGHMVLLITHNVLEAERAVDRLAVMNDAKVLAEGTPSSLKSLDKGRLRLGLTLEPQADLPDPPPWANQITEWGRRVYFSIDEDKANRAVEWVQELSKGRILEAYELGPSTLESNYLRLIGKE